MAHIDTSEIILGAVWLRPVGEALNRIEEVVNRMHRRAGGPQVQPHVTLLSGFETTRASAELKLKDLAQRLKAFSIKLGQIESGKDYFKSLFAVADSSDALARARADAYDAFEMKPAPPFKPHLSLLYGKIDEAVKKELAAEAGGKLDLSFEVRAVHLVNAAQSVPVSQWRDYLQHPVGAEG